MLKKLYLDGYLNYSDMILDNYPKLSLNVTEAFVLVKILDVFKSKQELKVSQLQKASNIDKKTLDSMISKFFELNYLQFTIEVKNGKGVEAYNLDNLFLVLESLTKENEDVPSTDNIISYLEGKFSRLLTAKELEIASSFTEKNITIKELSKVVDGILEKNSKLSLPLIERELFAKKAAKASSDDDLEALRIVNSIKKK